MYPSNFNYPTQPIRSATSHLNKTQLLRPALILEKEPPFNKTMNFPKNVSLSSKVKSFKSSLKIGETNFDNIELSANRTARQSLTR